MLWLTVAGIFIFALLFEPIRKWMQDYIDKNFFKVRYEADQVIKAFSEGVKSMVDIKQLAQFIVRIAQNTFKLSGCACYVFNENENEYECVAARGTLVAMSDKKYIKNDLLINEMKSSGSILTPERLKKVKNAIVRLNKPKEDTSQRMILDIKNYGYEMIIPCMSSKKEYKLIGFIIADKKLSGDRFNNDDIKLLETLANQSVVSIENSLLYKNQSETLEKSMKLEKLADLGKATAGVAIEAQNALSFVEKFSKELPEKKYEKKFLLESSERLFSEIERMRFLMQGILEYSKPSKVLKEPLKAKKLIESVTVLVADMINKQNIEFDIKIEDGLVIEFDKNLFKQIVLNLFLNSIEAMQNGGVISIRSGRRDKCIILEISDTGNGISNGIQDKIFDAFFSTKEHGVGLGLTTVKNIMISSEGAIEIESNFPHGTKAILKFSLEHLY